MKRLVLLIVLLANALPAAETGSQPASVRTAKGEPVADAVVSLTPLDGPGIAAPVAGTRIVQSDEQYAPFVTAVTPGSEIEFPNEDHVQHHLYSVSRPKRFEKPLYAPGSSESVVFDAPGVVALGCNIHDWMIAYVLVLETPFYAKTDDDGRAEVRAVPPGRYRMEVWQPRLARVESREIVVGASGNPTVEFAINLKPDRRIRRAPDSGKAGGY